MCSELREKQRRENQIAAALRILLAAALFCLQIAFVVLLAHFLQENAAYVYALLQAVALIFAIYVANRREPTAYKVSWILLLLALPVTGLILFWLWSGMHQSKQLSLKRLKPFGESESERAQSRLNIERLARTKPQWKRLAGYMQQRGFLLYRDTAAQYYSAGKDLFEALGCDLAAAEHFIFLEYFILADGSLSDSIFRILRERAQNGVEVKLVFDDLGSIGRLSDATRRALEDAGVEIKVFNPVHHYVNRLYFNYRDHRKLACIDGSIAYTGGVNIADEYADIIRRFGYWKDNGIRLEGEGAWGLTKQFIYMWERLGGAMQHEHDYYRSRINVTAQGFCQPFVDGPDNNPDNPAEDAVMQMIAAARHTLYILTPYFAVDDAMLSALCIAGDGGVDVRLVLPGTPDKKYTYILAESYFSELMAHGVKIYRYQPGFLHAKSILVDREAAFFGSVNMDYRSFQLHYECGALLYASSAVEELTEDIDHILEDSRRIMPQEWEKRGWLSRARQRALRLIAIWM